MSSIETLLEAAKYVDEDQSTVANKVMPLNNMVTMEKSQENAKSNNCPPVITHWRKRAVAQSVMESQTRDLLEKSSASSIKEDVASSVLINSTAPHANSSTWSGPLAKPSPHGNGLYPIIGPPMLPIHTAAQGHVNQSNSSKSSTIPAGDLTANGSTCKVTNLKISTNTSLTEALSRDAQSQPVVMQSLSSAGTDPLRKNVQFGFTKGDKQKSYQSGTVTREAHNLLEKNRRAHLKECFDNLRSVVPSLGTRKVSNLIVLQEALKYVQSLKRKEQKQEYEVEALARQKIDRQDRLAKLRRKLSLKLEPNDIDDLLKVDEGNDGMTKKLSSPVKSSLAGYGGSAAPAASHTGLPVNTKESPATTGSPIPKNPNPSGGRVSEFAKSLVLELIGKDLTQHADKFPSHLPIPPSLPFANLMHLPHIDLKKTMTPHVFGSLPNINFCKPDENLNTVKQINCPDVAKPKVSDRRGIGPEMPAVTTYKLSQISANSTNNSVCSLNDQTTISATVHRVHSTKPLKTRVVTSEISSFLDPGNGGNTLKIVVKPVDSAKQHALGSKTSTAQKTEPPKHASKAGSSRPRQTELVFRPRSSMTPPPPSRITPYFPRFSVGSGGSPPLTTIVPDISDVTSGPTGEVNGDRHPDPMMSQPQIVWKQSPGSNHYMESPKKHSTATFKRKLPNDQDFSGAKAARQSMPRFLSGSSERRTMPVATNVSSSALSVNSDTESETETAGPKIQEKSARSFIRAFLNSTSSILPIGEAKTKSVTQVCYSTDMKAVQPTVTSTLAMKSYTEPKTQDSQPQYPTPQLLNANLQFVSGSQQQVPQFAYQIVQPAFMNPTLLPTAIPGRYVNVKGTEANKTRGKGDTSQDQEDSSSRTEANVEITGPPQVVSSMAHIQSVPSNQVPQIQYVMPMGFTGMIGGGTQHMTAFPSAMGGFMQLASIPQGQGWGYVVPQGMVVEDNSKSVTQNGVSGRKTDAPSPSSQGPDKVTTSGAGKDSQPVQSTPPFTPNKAVPEASPTSNASPPIGRSSSTPQASVSAVPVQTMHISSNPPVEKWHEQTLPRAVQQPQFQIVRPNFQTSNPVMIPMGAASGGSYIIGGPQTGLSAVQGITTVPRCQAGIGYSFPIMGYQPMQINAPQMQIAALPNGSINIPRGLTYGIAGGVPAQLMTLNNSKQSTSQGNQGSVHPSTPS